MYARIATIAKRKLGDLTTSAIGYGCMGLSEFYGTPLEKDRAIEVIREAYKKGITHFDTADVYAFGDNESLLGEAIKPFRDKVTIATKCGIIRQKDDPTKRGVDNTANYIINACNASLARLAVDHIDLFYLHRFSPTVPIEESVAALASLVKQNKVRYIGLSEVDAETIRRAHRIHPITAVQIEYSLWTRGIETNGVLDVCRELNIGVVAYSPLGRGFLTATINNPSKFETADFRRTLPRFAESNISNNLSLVVLLEKMAEEKACTPAQLSLAWLLAKDDIIVPIPGTKNPDRITENLKALEIKLTADEIAYLDKISAEHAPQQPRYTDAAMKAYNLSQ